MFGAIRRGSSSRMSIILFSLSSGSFVKYVQQKITNIYIFFCLQDLNCTPLFGPFTKLPFHSK